MIISDSDQHPRSTERNTDRARRAAFAQVTTLFFAWGFVMATIDPLIPAVRAIFRLSYSESMLTQFSVFIAYGIVSIPAAGLVGRIGQARAVPLALGIMVAGCLTVPLATMTGIYAPLLAALFVIAAGVTMLQVAANPLAAALGPPGRASYRLTLSQAFNSLGTVIAPLIGSTVMLRGGVFATTATGAEGRDASLRAIDIDFLIIAALLAVIAILFWRVRRAVAAQALDEAEIGSPLAALRSGWALAGAGAIFLYVGAEVAIGSILIGFLTQSSILGVSPERGGHLVSLYWAGAMVGRFAGSALMTRIAPARLLALAAGIAVLLCLAVTQTHGMAAAVAALAVGLFNSIMFPTIFTLTLERSDAPVAATSGLLCSAIVGGAVLPLMTGRLADIMGTGPAFAVPLIAYALIALFAMIASRASRHAGQNGETVSANDMPAG